MANLGKYIALEGPDGAGKTTQLKLLKSAFEQSEVPHLVTREPGGTAVGAELRQILLTGDTGKIGALTEAFLFSADRCHLAASLIRPALAEGTFVISDRTYLTTLVFQGYGGCVPLHTLEQLTDLAVGDTRPDLMLVLMVSPEKGL
ncbi:MAG: dTMP kinase, partial [Pseudomonadota bacterium]